VVDTVSRVVQHLANAGTVIQKASNTYSENIHLGHTHTRRSIFLRSPPAAFSRPESQLQCPTLRKELVTYPILCIWLTVEQRALNIDVDVRVIEVKIPDSGSLVGLTAGGTDGFEERRCD